MGDIPPEGGEGEGEGAGPEGGAPLGTITLSEDQGLWETFDGVDTVDELVAAIDAARSEVESTIGMPERETVIGMMDSIRQAALQGEIEPGGVVDALGWVAQQEQTPDFTPNFVLGGGLNRALVLWAVHNGYTVTTPVTPAPLTVDQQAQVAALVDQGINALGAWWSNLVSSIEPGSQTPATGSLTGSGAIGLLPGYGPAPAQIVSHPIERAVANLAPVKITGSGIQQPVISAIQAVANHIWANVLNLVSSVADEVTQEIQAVGLIAEEAAYQAAQALQAAPPPSIPELPAAVDALHAELERVGAMADVALNDIQGVGQQAAAAAADIIDANYAAQGTQISSLEVAGAATALSVAGLTTQVGGLQNDIEENDADIASLEAVTQTQGSNIATLAADVADNAECCEEAHAVTDPINEGGATPSLLKQLGGLLGKAFEILFIASLVDVALAVLDMPAVVAATVWDAEQVSKWAQGAAGAATADISWTSQLMPPSG